MLFSGIIMYRSFFRFFVGNAGQFGLGRAVERKIYRKIRENVSTFEWRKRLKLSTSCFCRRPGKVITYTSHQDSANNSTLLPYLSKTRSFGNYLCMNLWKSRPSYSTRVRVEYLYFRQIWEKLVESSWVKQRYSCFLPYIWLNIRLGIRLGVK